MSDNHPNGKGRKPRAFTVEDPQSTPERQRSTGHKQSRVSAPAAHSRARANKPRKPATFPPTVEMTPVEDDPFLNAQADLDALTPPPAASRSRRLTPAKILFAALGFLAALAIGVWTDTLIRDLFDRLDWLGWIASATVTLACLAALVMIAREIAGLRRLARVAELRAELSAKAQPTDARQARALAKRVSNLIAANPLSARGRKALKALDDEIIDAPHYLAFAERELMTDLDRQARQLTLNAARRVCVVTAVSPRAFVDLAYVGFEVVRLIRAMAELYGGRPGTIGMVRLFRDIVAHLAVTGAVAAGDSLIQQVVGHGLAAKLSARLGEGVINGLMTARIGISAMDLCRPMPFNAVKRPSIGDFMSQIANFSGSDEKPDRPEQTG